MIDETEFLIAEYEKFPKSPTKEQREALMKRAGIDHNLRGIDIMKVFHKRYNVPFDEEWYNEVLRNRTIENE